MNSIYKNIKAPDFLKAKTLSAMQSAYSGKRRTAPLKKVAVCTAVCAACTFSGVAVNGMIYDPNNLHFTANYVGNGIVEIEIYNGTDKTVSFQDVYYLGSYENNEIPELSDKRDYNSVKLKPYQTETVSVDLKKAYDITALETDTSPYYIMLTDENFLHEHDWICSFRFAEPTYEETDTPDIPEEKITVQSGYFQSVEPKYLFYFEGDCESEENHSRYFDMVSEDIKGVDGNYVSAASMVNFPEYSLTVPEASFKEFNGEEFTFSFTSEMLDYRHFYILGERSYDVNENGRHVSNHKDGCFTVYLEYTPDGEKYPVQLPVYTGVSFRTADISSPDNICFIHGRFYKFAEIEHMKVFEDENYTIYGINSLMFDDSKRYFEENISISDTRKKEEICSSAVNVCEYLSENISELFEYCFYGE